MRRMLRILGWLGLGLSTVLFVGTGVVWVRSIGHREGWDFDRFEPRPDWTAPDVAGQGIWRDWYFEVIHGRLWLLSRTWAPVPAETSEAEHQRETITADQAKQLFDSVFQPGERPWLGGTEQAWRFAGVGFRHVRDAVYPQTGRPTHEVFTLAIPIWMLAVAFGLWPVCFTLRRLFRRRRYGAGLCPSCGYDLRATPERCPECGRAVAAGRGLGENG